MRDFREFTDFYNKEELLHKLVRKRKKRRGTLVYSDVIYTFDLESVSLFEHPEKGWDVFDPAYDAAYYSKIDKVCIPYIWQFGREDEVYYGRELDDFIFVLDKMRSNINKIIYVHNLSFELSFLEGIFKKHKIKIENMVANRPHKPISFFLPDYNIEFRCSYMLTNLSLEKAAEAKRVELHKLTGYLDYNQKFSPKSKLTEDELLYCEYDCKVLYQIIKKYKEEYKHLVDIPLTQTGIVRGALRSRLDFFYFRKQWETIPDRAIFLMLMQSFMGGLTHPNSLYSCGRKHQRTLEDVTTYDFASAYPFNMFLKLPQGRYFRVNPEHLDKYPTENYAHLVYVHFDHVKSKYFNNYISSSKCLGDGQRLTRDNGRVSEGWNFSMIINDIDLDLIRQSYKIEGMEIKRAYVSRKTYLDKRILEFILYLYKNKTSLKGLDHDIYMQSKEMINALFGCACYNPVKGACSYDNYTWSTAGMTEQVIDDKLEEMKHSFSTIFQYSVGTYITALNRKHLWEIIISDDKNIVYYDTDSIKVLPEFDTSAVVRYNEWVREAIKKCADDNELNIEDFSPLDPKGVKHTIGLFEKDGETASEFRTMGAKKYCYRDSKGLHLTVSGVRKSAVEAFKDDINNFKYGFTFDYESANKLTHFYVKNHKAISYIDKDGHRYRSSGRLCGTVLQPTTYTLGNTLEYEQVIEYLYSFNKLNLLMEE